ncbi:MAG TPA: twin-arginine translocase subunit TatC [Bryobacteraceae bacterium]|nr:twin-arginine translocase subunit TatC [Bryobacteraceae bacterium]
MDDEKQGGLTPAGEGPSSLPTENIPSPMAMVPVVAAPPAPPLPPTPASPPSPEDEEEQKMLRMSFMEHLEELRSRILNAVYGMVVAFVVSIVYCYKLWEIISEPAVAALKSLHVDPPVLISTTPMEGFSVIWVKLPLLCSIFLASPWIVYQVWAFIAPGLYKKERRWAVPFVLTTGGLFIAGGCFAYFLAFRYGLTFLLGISLVAGNVKPMVTITEYFDLFVNVTLGVGLVFELPVLIFLLTLLRVASPRFLIRHSRYAILIIVIVAAIVTPTPDVVNLMLFAVPMCALYFVGVFAGYLLVLHREGEKFPWKPVLRVTFIVLVVLAAVVGVFLLLHLHVHRDWPFITR